jgi:hypothetical protein
MKYTLKSKCDYDNSELTLEFEAEQLDDVLSQFQNFLRASGFVFDGYLDVVETKDPIFTDNSEKFNFERGVGSHYGDATYKTNFSIAEKENVNFNVSDHEFGKRYSININDK